jgi:hypothetical protein
MHMMIFLDGNFGRFDVFGWRYSCSLLDFQAEDAEQGRIFCQYLGPGALVVLWFVGDDFGG